MKRIILTLACASIFGATATFAQTDTTRSKSQTPQTPTQQQPAQQSDQLRTDDMKGWTQVQSSDVPASLRTTLGGTQYNGWDQSGTVYKNQNGDYSLRMGTGTSQKSYYFDKNGKAIAKPNNKPDHK
jgi:hypothetical protein